MLRRVRKADIVESYEQTKGTDMTDQEIKDIYDSNPNITLATLAIMAGVSVEELKKILMEEKA